MSIERTCDECKYSNVSATKEPCVDCDGPNCRFKPKEEGMGENDKQMELENEKMREELEVARAKIEDMEHKARMHWNEMAMLKGEVAGLKFALRCNGVSGGEVR